VHAFGSKGSAEALGETELVLRMSGAPPKRLSFEPVDAQRAELEAFADAIQGKAPFPIPAAQMLQTVCAFEAVIGALRSGGPVEVRQ
jgi:predicted dehydrogenase